MTNKLIIITGAGSGIGQALAIKLAKQGHLVWGIGRRVNRLQETQAFCPENIHILPADISKVDDRKIIAEQVSAIKKTVYLVHNAASAEPLALLKDITLEEWRQQQAINVEAPLFLTQSLLSYLNNGRILHISSGLAHGYCPGAAAYCSSKAALYMLYLALREELKEQNIAVGSADPGAVDTPMQEIIRSSSPERLPVVESFIRFKKEGQLIPAEIVADFLSWLLIETNDSDFSKQEWNITDPSHHSYWLKNKNINMQFNL